MKASHHLENYLKECIYKILLGKDVGKMSAYDEMHACMLSHVQLSVTPWTVACQALLSMGFFQARILEWVAMPSSRRSS